MQSRFHNSLTRPLVVFIAVVLILTGCVTVHSTTIEQIQEPVIEEKIEEKIVVEETTEPEVQTERVQLVTPKVSEVQSDDIWDTVFAMRDEAKKVKVEETEQAKTFINELFACVPTETTEEIKFTEETIGEEPVAVEETLSTRLLDEEDQKKIDSTVVMGELTPVTIKAEDETASVSQTTNPDRIIYSNTGPLWLYSDKEKTVVSENTPINVSVIQEAQKEVVDDGIKPEDIISLSQSYKADRETEKKVSQMTTLEIYDKAMGILQRNYQYVFLAFAVLIMALLIKVFVKHLHSEKKKNKGAIKGKTFTAEETSVVTMNPATMTYSDLLVAKKEDEEDNDEPTEREKAKHREKGLGDKFMKFFKEDGEDVIIDTSTEELSLSEACDLAGMLMDSGFGTAEAV